MTTNEVMKMPQYFNNLINYIPGIALSCLCALLASLIHHLPFPPFTVNHSHPVDVLALGLFLGILLRHMVSLSPHSLTGIRWSSKTFLAIGIALLGAKLDLFVILKHSGDSLWLSVLCVIVALILTEFLGIRLGVPQRLARLIAIGTAICGGTAIAVTSATLEANEEEVALSIASVTLFGLLCILCLPIIGHQLELTQAQFGLWSGVVVHATPQVVATSYAYGAEAGELAIIVKMTRVLLLAPLLMVLQLIYAKNKNSEQTILAILPKVFPLFLVVFLILASLNSFQLLPEHLLGTHINLDQSLLYISKYSMIIAMSAIGLMVNLSQLTTLGIRPILGGLLATLVMAIFSLSLIY
jgi:uncharacterized integral membrane protein (TIGR00698 family)